MGLYIHSISQLPISEERDYYLYVLDYGWHDPLGEALYANFKRMADLASKNNAVILAGTDPRAFAGEILSAHIDDEQFNWAHINGEHGEEVLPALMISTIHPRRFRGENHCYRPRISSRGAADDKLIIIPLRDTCESTTEVASLIERIFRDIAAKKPLTDFAVAKEIKAGSGNGAMSDALILKPTLWGMGVDLRELVRAFKSRHN